MAPKFRLAAAGAAAALIALVAGVAVWPGQGSGESKPELGLFTSLPIFWAETASVSEALDANAAPHWARTVLEAQNRLVPLDTLDAGDLRRLDRLVMAQPRPLSPAENVALDDWVRAGGRVLLFADPMLTGDTRFAIGDKRRPQDVVMLSPILNRWGLKLEFDDSADLDERMVEVFGARVAINLPGRLVATSADCAVESEGLAARCRVGKGAAMVVADAAMLEAERGPEESADTLRALTKATFER